MVERTENRDSAPARESRPAGFTDASYIPRDEAPNLPRVYTFPEAKEEKEKTPVRLSGRTAALLCVLCLCLGVAVQSRLSRSGGETPAPEPAPSAAELLRAATATPVPPLPTGGPLPENGSAEDRSCLGVTVQTVTGAVADYYNHFSPDCMVEGVHIYAVEDGGAAARAGLRKGDILTAVDGRAVLTAAELSDTEYRYRPGDRAVLTVYRECGYLEVPVEFASRSPEADDDAEW